MSELSFQIIAPILRLEDGMRMHYAPLPLDISDAFEAVGVRRVIVNLNGLEARRAIMGRKDGERHILFGIPFLREAKVKEGDMAPLEIRTDPDPNMIDMGEEFTEVLEMDEEAAARFYGMTPGKQRSLAYYVTSAKREETRIKRALELAHKLKTYTLYGDKNK